MSARGNLFPLGGPFEPGGCYEDISLQLISVQADFFAAKMWIANAALRVAPVGADVLRILGGQGRG